MTMLADWIHFRPMSYVVRGLMGIGAFVAAMNVDHTWSRVTGFVFLLLVGVGLLLAGISHGTWIDILVGVVALSAAGYSWWYTRH